MRLSVSLPLDKSTTQSMEMQVVLAHGGKFFQAEPFQELHGFSHVCDPTDAHCISNFLQTNILKISYTIVEHNKSMITMLLHTRGCKSIPKAQWYPD
jgi:hypothetical protein